MIIYEVNLRINTVIQSEFMVWLAPHVAEMLYFKGFLKASYLLQRSDPIEDVYQLTMQYQIATQADLEDYLTHHASKMREEGLIKFPNQFSATRRIFEVDEVLSHDSV